MMINNPFSCSLPTFCGSCSYKMSYTKNTKLEVEDGEILYTHTQFAHGSWIIYSSCFTIKFEPILNFSTSDGILKSIILSAFHTECTHIICSAHWCICCSLD